MDADTRRAFEALDAKLDTALARAGKRDVLLAQVATRLSNHIGQQHTPDECPRIERHEREHRDRDRLFWVKVGALQGFITTVAGIVFWLLKAGG